MFSVESSSLLVRLNPSSVLIDLSTGLWCRRLRFYYMILVRIYNIIVLIEILIKFMLSSIS